MALERLERFYLPPNVCDSEVPKAEEIMEGLWRCDPLTESWYSISPSNGNHASKEVNAVHGEYFFVNISEKL